MEFGTSQPIYSGRAIICGRSEENPFVAYRLSSRSFPNRQLRILESGRVQVVASLPDSHQAITAARFIYYDCLIAHKDAVVVANGLHSESIAVKVKRGLPPLDALALGLMAWDYEDDAAGTPRIAGVLSLVDPMHIVLGIAKRDCVHVERFALQDDRAFVISTNGFNSMGASLHWTSAGGAANVAAAAFAGQFEVMLSPAITCAAWQRGELAVIAGGDETA